MTSKDFVGLLRCKEDLIDAQVRCIDNPALVKIAEDYHEKVAVASLKALELVDDSLAARCEILYRLFSENSDELPDEFNIASLRDESQMVKKAHLPLNNRDDPTDPQVGGMLQQEQMPNPVEAPAEVDPRNQLRQLLLRQIRNAQLALTNAIPDNITARLAAAFTRANMERGAQVVIPLLFQLIRFSYSALSFSVINLVSETTEARGIIREMDFSLLHRVELEAFNKTTQIIEETIVILRARPASAATAQEILVLQALLAERTQLHNDYRKVGKEGIMGGVLLRSVFEVTKKTIWSIIYVVFLPVIGYDGIIYLFKKLGDLLDNVSGGNFYSLLSSLQDVYGLSEAAASGLGQVRDVTAAGLGQARGAAGAALQELDPENRIGGLMNVIGGAVQDARVAAQVGARGAIDMVLSNPTGAGAASAVQNAAAAAAAAISNRLPTSAGTAEVIGEWLTPSGINKKIRWLLKNTWRVYFVIPVIVRNYLWLISFIWSLIYSINTSVSNNSNEAEIALRRIYVADAARLNAEARGLGNAAVVANANARNGNGSYYYANNGFGSGMFVPAGVVRAPAAPLAPDATVYNRVRRWTGLGGKRRTRKHKEKKRAHNTRK
jgi:hypothetical protein